VAQFLVFLLGDADAGYEAHLGRIDRVDQVVGRDDLAVFAGRGIYPIASPVLHYGVVFGIVVTMIEFVAGDKEVDCVAIGLNLIDWHLFNIHG
jgi:hypothetical protein